MKRLSNAHITLSLDIRTQLDDAFKELDEVISAFNTLVEEYTEKINDKRENYNFLLDQAAGWAHGIASEIQEYIDERSDKWKESERGQSYIEWQSQYENFDVDSFKYEVDDPQTMDEPDMPENIFEELPEEVDV